MTILLFASDLLVVNPPLVNILQADVVLYKVFEMAHLIMFCDIELLAYRQGHKSCCKVMVYSELPLSVTEIH